MTQKNTQSETTGADVEALKKEIETLKKDLLRLTETVGKVGEAKLRESLDGVKERIASEIPPEQLEKFDALKDQGEEAIEAIRRQQKEHPVGTLLVAAGVGFLLGKILGGKN
ncbi:DUF883 family protein [Hydrogenimonas urashimensis]|uniref:DUF883 family protein n=1 Tax=Hydrogenimonas urashimensis TaxID=2740515 RepID=UPI001914DF39|nr:hypothetical protein [Hydrogenimonas urashimensis]